MAKLSPTPEKKELHIETCNIPGMLIINLPVNWDSRGFFKENYQREKLVALGFPEDFVPLQNNISFNAQKGATRGIHAEPWDKFVSVGSGRAFCAWIDMREGFEPQKFTLELDPSIAVFVPRGVGNSYQALEDNTVYTYLTNDYWHADGEYLATNLSEINNWPIPLDQAEISEKDKVNPGFAEVNKMTSKKILIVGAYGQLGQALKEYFPHAECVDLDTFNISDPSAYQGRRWRDYSVIINAAAYTNVDGAETAEGRKICWSANATAVMLLAKVAQQNNITLVHVSSDYVFDGTKVPHVEDEPFSPLSVYGQSKAAGDIAASIVPKHYLVRTSWVVGKGKNFAKTMFELANKGVKPTVVSDQLGRLTFTDDLAGGIHHLVTTRQDYGTYNLTNTGDVVSWADIAKIVYKASGHNERDVTGVSTTDYYAGKEDIAPRPLLSELDLSKLKAAGFTPEDWRVRLTNYIEELKKELA